VSGRTVLAVVQHELKVSWRDPTPLVALVVMPLLAITFVRPMLGLALAHEGHAGAGGEIQAVPALGVMFAFFLVAFGGFSFYQEHEWGTWDRLRASPASMAEIVVGKLLVICGIVLAQLATLFAVGGLAFDLPVAETFAWLLPVAVALSLAITALVAALVAICRSVRQFNALALLIAIVFGGLGGSLAPTDLLPGWAQAVAPATPAYWAIRGFRSVLLEGGAHPDAWRATAALLGFAIVFAAVAAWRFDARGAKVSWN
jgi:ABC-2 type transport system permease protein